ncbi:MAG: hypothetical protein ACMUIE_03425, partial [Thermoplasmatota archaeon]
MSDTHEIEADLGFIQNEVTCLLAATEDHNYDDARGIVKELIEGLERGNDIFWARKRMKEVFFCQQRNVMKRFLLDECDVGKARVDDLVRKMTSVDELRIAAESIDRMGKGRLSGDYSKRIENWERRTEDIADRLFHMADMFRKLYRDESGALYSSTLVDDIRERTTEEALHGLLRFIYRRISNAPRLKDLSKPTIVLVGGTSGTGKTTISQHISDEFSFPIYASTDVIARGVVRRVISWGIGDERARSAFPELFGSSFEGPNMEWYYIHSLMTMVGVVGLIEGLISKNRSAVIEGVPLVPGTIPVKYFEAANIVWMISTVKDPEVHYQRYAGRERAGVSRGGAQRYRSKFESIRRIHDQISRMAMLTGTLKLDNTGSLDETLSFASDHVISPFADKGLMVEDQYRDSAFFEISRRRGSISAGISDPHELRSTNLRINGPEPAGISRENVERALSIWLERSQQDIIELQRKLERARKEGREDACDSIDASISERMTDIIIARDVIGPGIIEELLCNNQEYLKATRSLLVQIRWLHVQLLARLCIVPGIKYDDARISVHSLFNDKKNRRDIENFKHSVKELMIVELVEKVKILLESQFDLRRDELDKAFSGIGDLLRLRGSINTIMDRFKWELKDIGEPRFQCENLINIWEENLDKAVLKNFEIYEHLDIMEKAEVDQLYEDESLKEVRNRVERHVLHRLVRWIAPRLLQVPRIKELEKEPTLILVNGTYGIETSAVQYHISKSLSIPICFDSDVISSVTRITLEWLFGKGDLIGSFPELYPDPGSSPWLDRYHTRMLITMIGMRGALDRLIKENTSAVIAGD